jgi:hypothetical protein
MKTDRRHNLQTNWLADHLGRWLEKIKPYTNHILAGAFLLAAAGVVWLVVARFWSGDQEAAWRELGDASQVALNQRLSSETADITKELQQLFDQRRKLLPPISGSEAEQEKYRQRVKQLDDEIEVLRKEFDRKRQAVLARQQEELYRTAKESIGTVAGRALAFAAASKDLSEGSETLLADPVGARDKLDRAVEFFELVKKHADDDLLRQRAQFQLARAYETRLKRDPQHEENDDLAKAAAEYEALIKEDSYCKAEAQQRLAELNKSKSLFRLLSQRIDEGEAGPAKGKESAKTAGAN